jgi:hypothetical protein
MNINTGINLVRKPKSIKCYLCGHEFGTSSLEIHMRQCKSKVENEKGKKVFIPIEYEDLFMRLKNKENLTIAELDEFNDYANELYKDETLVPCFNCGRRFIKESLEKHQKMCKNKDEESLKKFSKDKGVNSRKSSVPHNSNDLFLQKLNNELIKENENATQGKYRNKSEINENYLKSMSPTKKDQNYSKPKVLTCYICGREFGLTSLEIHMKTCQKTFYNEESNKNKKLPDNLPDNLIMILNSIHMKTEVSHEDINNYNNEATEIYRCLNFEECINCGRRMPLDRLKVHMNGCKNNSKGNIVSSTKILEEKLKAQLDEDSNNSKKKPQFLMCYICGREFSRFSLEIHIKQCVEKFKIDEEKRGIKSVKIPEIPKLLINILNKTLEGVDVSNNEIGNYNNLANDLYKEFAMKTCLNCGRKFKPESLLIHLKSCNKGSSSKKDSMFEGVKAPNMMSRPKMLICPLCGREFGSLSLEIHMKTCRQKFEIEQSNLPKNQRKFADKIIENYEKNKLALQADGNYSLEKMNEDAYNIWSKESLMPCEICGRTFLPQSLVIHKRSCKPKNSKK